MVLSFKNEVALTLLLRSEADSSRRVLDGETVNGWKHRRSGPQWSEDTGGAGNDRMAGAWRLTGLPALAKGDEENRDLATCPARHVPIAALTARVGP